MANGNGAKAEVLKKSVTRADHPENPRAGVYRFQFPSLLEFQVGLPGYGTPARDYHLRYSTLREAQWASAVHIAQTKVASLDAEITGESDSTRLARWQELWVQVDRNQSPVAYLEKGVRDYLTTNNGQFIEIVRATQGLGGRILGLVHLDSLRCKRTGDDDTPVLFRDLKGVEHELRDYQVLMLADDPDPSESFFGMGHCAAERAWHTVIRLSGIETYVTEKVTGQRALAIHIVNGNVDEQMLIDAITTAKDMRQEQGYTQFMGAVIIPLVDPTATPNVATIPLAELPDGFEPDAERKRADLVYANALGIDPQEVNPDLLASRAMGTGAQSRVIEEKEAGKGLVTWRKKFPHLVNQFVFPDRVTFAFSERDLRDEQAQAQVALVRAQVRQQQVTTGEITPQEARQLAVDADDLPREFLQGQDLTAGETLTDDEKPLPDVQPTQAAPVPVAPTPIQPTAAEQVQQQKQARDYPPALQALIVQAELDISGATESLRRKELSVEEWRTRVADIIFNFHAQAYRAGARAGERELTPPEQRLIELQAQEQVAYLTRFANEIEASAEWQETWTNRAGLYANSIGASYWNGRTKELPLPAMPGEGTQCLSNCKCAWRVEWIDREKGDADAFWEWEESAAHCQTCIERRQQWYPLRIRGGSLQ